MKIVIRVGGSIIVDESGKYDIRLLRDLKKYMEEISKKHKMYILVGGGKYIKGIMKLLKENFGVSDRDLDRIGIEMTWINAEIIRSILENSYDKILRDYRKIPKTKKILVGGGWKAGATTDWNAVFLAKKVNADVIVKLTDVDGIYDKNPKKYKNAKLIEKMSWEDLLKLAGERKPGMSFPFDPVAAKLASSLRIKLVVINGKKLENLKKFLEGKKFVGTIVE